MQVDDFLEFSLVDYPGKISCVVFCFGCNFRCGFCHNPELVLNNCRVDSFNDENKFFSFLANRVDKLDAVSITGGEPTLQNGLIDFILKIKSMGFFVKLDTNGSRLDVLKKILKLGCVDNISMDIKSSFDKYSEVAGVDVDCDEIAKSISVLKNCDIDYEFRTTVLRKFHDDFEIAKIAKIVNGAKKFVLQNFVVRENGMIGDFDSSQSFNENELERFARIFEKVVDKVEIRI